MTLRDLSMQRDAFSIECSRPVPNRLHIVFDGSADMRVQNDLSAWVFKIHDDLRRTRVANVTLNMQKLEFLSSGCFKGLCTWIRLMLERGTDYKLTIVMNPAYHWQSRSLDALRMLAPDLVYLTKE